jgi:hypothetical protein
MVLVSPPPAPTAWLSGALIGRVSKNSCTPPRGPPSGASGPKNRCGICSIFLGFLEPNPLLTRRAGDAPIFLLTL